MDTASSSSDQSNGKITLAVLSTKLDHLLSLMKDLKDQSAKDHDTITTLTTQMEDLQYIKRVVAGVVVGMVLALALALYAVSQQVAAAFP